jgi:iduronate 2-sulfatase
MQFIITITLYYLTILSTFSSIIIITTVPLCTAAAASLLTKRPNILLIYADDLRVDLPPYNKELPVPMPAFQKLSDNSFTFARVYTSQTVCAPSRATFLAGRRPDILQTWNFLHTIRDSAPKVKSLPQVFREAGYYTMSIGKVFHWINSTTIRGLEDDSLYSWNSSVLPAKGDGGSECGNYTWCSCDESPTEPICPDRQIASTAITSLQNFATNQRNFFLAVGFRRPHTAYIYPGSFRAQFANITVKPPAVIVPAHFNDINAGGMPTLAFYSCIAAKPKLDVIGPMVPDIPLLPNVTAALRREYWTATAYVDSQLHRVLTALDDTGLSNSTLVIFTSDHGYSLGERNMWCKSSLFEVTSRIPMMIRVPSIMRGGGADHKNKGIVIKDIIENVDVMPTLITMVLGSKYVPPCMMGKDFSSLLLLGLSKVKNNHQIHHSKQQWALTQYPRCPNAPAIARSLNIWSDPCTNQDPKTYSYMGYSLRTERWRYTEWRRWNGVMADWTPAGLNATELYDHSQDEWIGNPRFDSMENINLMDKYPTNKALIKRLSTQLRKAALGWSDGKRYDKSCLPSTLLM